MKKITTILLVVLTVSCITQKKLDEKINEIDPYICDDGSLDCTCEDAARHLGCLEPTDPHDNAIYGPGLGAKRVWRRSDLKHLTRAPKPAGSSPAH